MLGLLKFHTTIIDDIDIDKLLLEVTLIKK